MKRIGLGLGDPEHIKVVTELAAPTFEWTKKQGVVWRTDLTGKGGHSARRCLITEEGTGQGILIPFMKKLKELGVPVVTSVKVICLLLKQKRSCHWCYSSGRLQVRQRRFR